MKWLQNIWLQRDGPRGRLWHCPTWVSPPGYENDAAFRKWAPSIQSYDVRLIKDSDGKIDEEVYEILMEKLSGQDIIHFSDTLRTD